MKRTTIFIPEALERDMQLYARHRGQPVASVVREAIAAYIAGDSKTASLPSFAGAFDSGHTDTAERHEALLFARLDPHGTAEPTVPARPSPVRPRRSAPSPRQARHRKAR